MIVHGQFKMQDYIIPLMQLGGSALNNMPANDGVEIVSDSASDVNQITIFGTTYGTNLLAYETVNMNGTNAVPTVRTDWNNVYGFFLGDIYGKFSTVAVGTITVREASGNATIGTLTAGVRSTGSLAFNLAGREVYFHNVTGNTWLNANGKGIYPTTNNSFKYTAARDDDMTIPGGGFLYLLGDGTGSTCQIRVMKTQ